MKKTLRSFLTLLLVFVMLFSVVAPTAYAASQQVDDTTASTTSPTSEEQPLKWFEVSHDADGISVVLKPSTDKLKATSVAGVKKLLGKLIDAIYEVIIDEIKHGIAEGEYGDGVSAITPENAFDYAFDAYIDAHYNGADLDAKYQEFYAAVFADDDTNPTITALADYVCGLVEMVVEVGVISKAELPSADEARRKIEASLDAHQHIADPAVFAEKRAEGIEIMLAKYTETLNGAADIPVMGLVDVIGCLETIGVTVDGTRYGILAPVAGEGALFSRDELVGFINALPTFEEISTTPDEDMHWSFTFDITASYGDFADVNCDFDVTLSVGGDTAEELKANGARVRNLARLIDEHFEYSVDTDNFIVLYFTMPEKVDAVVRALLNTNDVPDDLKRQFYATFSTKISEIIANLEALDFDTLIEKIATINLEGMVTAPMIKKLVDLTGYTNEQIINKIKSYEKVIMKVLEVMIDVFKLLPAEYQDKTLLDFYNSDGSFGYAGTHNVDLEGLFTTITEKYGPLLASFFGDDFDVMTFDVSLTFDAIHKVEYVIDGKVVSYGMLPSGANLAFFGPKTHGIDTVSYWVDEDGNAQFTMPKHDVKLTPVYKQYDIEWDYITAITYDGQPHNIELVNVPDGYDVTYTYEYADGTPVTNPTNAGSYVAKATITKDGEVVDLGVENLNFTILKRTIDFSAVVWTDGNLYYNANEQSVTLSGLPDTLPEGAIVYAGNTATVPGDYTATVTINLDTANYEVQGFTAPSYDWSIGLGVIDVSGVSVPEKYTVTYDGAAHSVPVTGADTLPANVRVHSPSKTAAGVYNVTITFEVTGADAAYYAPIPSLTSVLEIIGTSRNEFLYKDSAGNILVSVTAPGGIPFDYELLVADTSFAHTGYHLADGTYGKVVVAYDINFAHNGTIQSLEDDFEVKMLIPLLARDKTNLQIVYIKDDGTTEQIPAVVEGDYLVFEVTHFSTYSIVEITDAPVPPTQLDLTWLWILLAVVGTLLVVGLVIFLILRKRGKKDDKPTDPTETPDKPDTPDGDTDAAPVEEAPVEEAPVEEAPVEEAPVEETPVEEAPVEEAPVEEAPVEEAPVEEAPVEEAPVEEAPVEEAPVEEAPVEEAPVEEAPVEEAPVEEAPVEEAPVVEAVVEETPVEAPVEEPVAEEPKKKPVIIRFADSDEEGERRGDIDGEVVLVRFRTSFESRFIQSSEEIQSYYSAIKNTLLSYKGVKCRTSWNYEAFNKGRVKCAKVNIKGSAIIVQLALNPADYNANKYHFTDMSAKPKYEGLALVMKVRSERSLKYTLELIAEMMRVLEIPEGKAQDIDYRMPYETTEQLASRGLVKVILPPGMMLDENSNVVRVDVGELLAAHEPTETEPVVEEAPVEEPVVEEVVEEAPVEEAPVEEAPVEETPAEDAPETEDDDDAFDFGVRYNYSLEARLALASDEVKGFYREIMAFVKSYGVKVSRSWKHERVHKGRRLFALVAFRGTRLVIALAKDPKSADAKYNAVDVSEYKKYEKTPMLMRVTSQRKVKQVIALLSELFLEAELKDKALGIVEPEIEAKTKARLIAEELIKVEGEYTEPVAEEAPVEAPVVEEVVEEAPVEEPVVEEVVEEAPVEEPVVEEVVEETPVEVPVVEEVVEEAPVEEPVVEEVVEDEVVEAEVVHVDAEHADEMLTNEEAEAVIEVVHTGADKRKGKLAIVNLDVICDNFEDGEVVDLKALKAKGIVPKGTARVKVLARGVMTKTLTVIASKYSLAAVKMIHLAGGHAEVED